MPSLKIIVAILFPIALLITGCVTKESKNVITTTQFPPTISPTAFATATEKATSSSPVITPTILPIIPTLPNEEAYALLFQMLQADGKCEIPCWLNITAGQSSLADVYFAWAPLQGITATYTEFPATDMGSMDFIYKMNGYNLKIFTNYSVSHSTEMIESIDVFTEATHYLGSDQFEYAYAAEIYKTALSAYLLPNVLSTYGPPDRILISTEIISAEPTSPDYFSIWLLYPSRGTIIQYEGSAEIRDNVIQGCPSDTFVSLWLVDPDNTKLYEDTLINATGHSDIVTGSLYYKSTMDAVGISAEEFYEVFKYPTDRCIESLLHIWPEP